MEGFLAIFGLAMIYSWGHLLYINIKKIKDVSDYETAVIVFAWFTFVLYVIGTLTS